MDNKTTSQNLTNGQINSTAIIANISKLYAGDVHFFECLKSIKETTESVQGGDMGSMETMLTSQAIALDNLFAGLTCRASMNMGEHMPAALAYMKLALKAQTQCQSTIESLAHIKQKQQQATVIQNNIAQYQQVNNGASLIPHTPDEPEKMTNELLDYAEQ